MQEKVLKLHLKALNSMVKLDNNQQAFFALVRAGLWEQNVQLSQPEEISFKEVYRLAEEQSVMGLVAAGIEHVQDVKVPQKIALSFVGCTLQLERRNILMDKEVASLFELLCKRKINALMLKGQGIAQCYSRPHWRASGDIDLLLDDENYEKAKALLISKSTFVETEYTSEKHLGMMFGDVNVELHGTMHTRLSAKIDKLIDNVQEDTIKNGKTKIWENAGVEVKIPAPDNDVIFIFTHIIKHFYLEGIGLRQICDWCRFLWVYKETLNRKLLEDRLSEMGLMDEWRSFATLAVNWLGMPIEAMPFYSGSHKWQKKAEDVVSFVLLTGNFGHNRKSLISESYLSGKIRSMVRKISDFTNHFKIFPVNSIKFFCYFMKEGLGNVSRGE